VQIYANMCASVILILHVLKLNDNTLVSLITTVYIWLLV